MSNTGPTKDEPTLAQVRRQFEIARAKIRQIEERARREGPPGSGTPPVDEGPGGSGAPAAPKP